MRTSLQKPKASQETTRSTIPGQAHFGQSPGVRSILHLQQTAGNRTVQRMLQVQRKPAAPDPKRAAAVEEAEDVAYVSEEQGEAQSSAEMELKLKGNKRRDKSYAWSLGMKDRARLQKLSELSPAIRQEIVTKMHFFDGEAKAAYLQTINPALSTFPAEQVVEILESPPGASAADKQKPTCDLAQQEFPLELEGKPGKTRCRDIKDPEFAKSYFDNNIKSVVGYSIEGTTWENVHYDSFNVMLVTYKNGSSEYFPMDRVGNFYYGGKAHGTLDFVFVKRDNGFIYPYLNGQLYSNERLTPNLVAYKNGLIYQVKELQELYTLLQVAGAHASIMGAYGAGAGSFKASINAFKRSGPARLPGKPLPGTPARQKSSNKNGVPEPISDEEITQRIRTDDVGERVGDFNIAGDKGLKGKAFERDIWGIRNVHGPAPSKTLDIRPLMNLVRSFIQEAKTAGATELRITGNAIRNLNVFKLQGLAKHFGGTLERTGAREVAVVIPVP